MNNLEIYRLFLNIDFWSALCGFIGALLIFFFSLPPKVDPDGHINLILEQESKGDKKKGKKYKKISYGGILLLVISFFLQLIKILFVN
jgi:hypothetical protein